MNGVFAARLTSLVHSRVQKVAPTSVPACKIDEVGGMLRVGFEPDRLSLTENLRAREVSHARLPPPTCQTISGREQRFQPVEDIVAALDFLQQRYRPEFPRLTIETPSDRAAFFAMCIATEEGAAEDPPPFAMCHSKRQRPRSFLTAASTSSVTGLLAAASKRDRSTSGCSSTCSSKAATSSLTA